jgi:glycosyltransferase involved in cell wall biosynthesis
MKICYFGTYRSDYSRNLIMIDGLRKVGVEVIECHETLWHGIEDRITTLSGGWKKLRFWGRAIKIYTSLLIKYFYVGDYDAMVVGYPGQFDVYLARILTWLKRKPLIWDVLMSIALVAEERGLAEKNRFIVDVIRFFEKTACFLPDQLIIESRQYAEWFKTIYSVPLERFCLVPLGANERKFFPRPFAKKEQPNFTVLYYGSFIPNHGVSTMLEAARKLQVHADIQFIFAGEGPLRSEFQKEASSLSNVQFTGYMSDEELMEIITRADVCFGVFGQTKQSMMTIQNKIYECLAMAKPLVTGASERVNEVFIHKKHLFICERNADSLVDALLELKSNPDMREFIGKNGHEYFLENFRTEKIGHHFLSCLNNLAI